MKVALVEFFVAEHKTYIFVIDPGKSASIKRPWVHELDLEEQSFEAAATLIWSFGRDSMIIESNLALFQELGERLLRPVMDYVGQCDILYLVPHKGLHYFPLHAVLVDGRPLCEQVATVYLPSASLLRFCQTNNALRKQGDNPDWEVLVMGVGAKEDSAAQRRAFVREAKEIAALFTKAKTHCFTGVRATKRVFHDYSGGASLIHIASHGFFDRGQPLGSGPLLASGRNLPSRHEKDNSSYILKAEDFYRLRLTANLVVINGCSTGKSGLRAGDELLGLARGVFAAGVPSMILSLWEAHHGAASAFAKFFYRDLLAGKPKALAFQEAQRQVRHEPGYRDLRYWAPFILLGDWL